MNAIVGIDVSKDTLDVCLLLPEGQKHTMSEPNTKSGINKLHKLLKKHGAKTAHVCLEATGVYGDLVAETLHTRGYTMSVVNPARIKAYANSQMQRNKTDQLDAALIADFCRTQQPAVWTPPTPEERELRALVRHLDDLQQEKQRASNRLEAQMASSAVRKQLRSQIDFLESQIELTKELIRDHIDRHPDLKQQHELLTSIPGIGDLTAFRLLAELGDVTRFDSVGELVAFVGLNPRQHQSGRKRVTTGISRMGRASLRAALYMPAIVAKRSNPHLAKWAAALEQRGLTGKQTVVAVMRKLLHLAYGVLKSGCKFDLHYRQNLAAAA